jgi:mono/diheme cytochrome c family protein
MPKTLRFLIPLSVLLLSACSFSLAEDVVPPAGLDQQNVVQPSPVAISGPLYPIVAPDPVDGAAVYADKCQPCHGDKGLGDGPMSSRSVVPVAAIGTTDVARSSTPAEWYTLLTVGNLERGMPPFKSLNDRQKWDVIAYVYQLSSPDEVLSQGEELYAANCARCHGESGHGDGADAAGLAAAPRDFSDQEWMAGLSAEKMFESISNGVGDSMPAYASELAEGERWVLTAYLRNLSFTVPAPGGTSEEASSAYPAPAEANQAYPEPVENAAAYPEPALEATDTLTGVGSVRIELVTGTGGKVTASEAPVTLYGFDNMQNTYSQTLTTNDQGVYTFENVEMPVGRAFIAGVDYAGGTYGSDLVVAEESVSELALQIKIFESSSDASVLTTDRIHIFLDFIEDGSVQVVEVFVISNPTDSAIVSAEAGGPVATFLLPEAATNLQFQDGVLGGRYLEIPGGFADTSTVQPGTGQYQVVFAYDMPYKDKLDFAQTMTMEANAVVIMLPDSGIKIKGEQITDDGTRAMQDITYHLYSGAGLQTGDRLEFTISGKMKAGTQAVTTSSTKSIAIGLGAFGLALVGAGVWLYARNRQQKAEDGSMEVEGEALPVSQPGPQDSAALMDAIIALDDLYQADKLPEEAYLQRRGELKAQLKQAMDNQG